MMLDCGHEPTVTTGCGTGYGTTSDGKRYCYACSHARELEQMHGRGEVTGYLSSDGNTITDWPGGVLLRCTNEWQTAAGGFSRTIITRVTAVDDTGRRWYGRGPGRGMYIRMHRSVRSCD